MICSLFLQVYTLTCLGSVTTANREYQVAFQRENRDLPLFTYLYVLSVLPSLQALRSLRTLKLGNVLLRALAPSELPQPKAPLAGSIAHHELAEYNQPQKQAILAACEGASCFTLIQGPPGTGKTRTIIGILQKLVKQQHHILVCAPSNAAVDELLARMIEKGLGVANGTSPPLVRLGKRDVVTQRVQVTLIRVAPFFVLRSLGDRCSISSSMNFSQQSFIRPRTRTNSGRQQSVL